ncbi:MAG: DNA recombination protein RmuC [Alphaproteobacteria bacterium]|nr:DNA recombination protein RmuC [Alphaproteobacteria bacterium]
MPLPLPSVQEPATGPEIAAQPAETLAAARPFIEGPDMALWVGFGAFIFIFLIVLLVIVRGRVIAPARRKAKDATFFEPAGEDADITFDEPALSEPEPPQSARDRRRKRRESKPKIEEPLVFSEPEEAGASEDSPPPDEIQADEHKAEDIPAPVKKRRAPFAGLFGKRAPKAEQGDLGQAPEDSLAAAATDAPDDEGEDGRNTPERHLAEDNAQFERAEESRLEEEETERLRAVDERDQIYRQAREQAEREAELDRANAEAALEQRMQSVATMQRKLAEKEAALKSGADAGPSEQLSETLEQRFAALSDELNAKLQTTAMTVHASPLTQAAALTETAQPQQREVTAELADFFSREIKGLRDITEDALALLAFKIDQINVTPDGAAELSRQISTLNASLATRTAPSTAGRIQLGDIVRNALPADRYAFSHRLASGRIADCLILAPDATSDAIAIDAHYPVEAFDDYVRAGVSANDKVKNEYRRTILRHIAAVAEKLIVPGETENFAVMFAPSEAIFNDLHTSFADVVQDSYRAKVWILSPTSLMATLHMMAAIAGDVRRKSANAAPANDALLSEIAELRQRMASLEEGRRGADPAAQEQAEADEPEPELFDAPDDNPAAPVQGMAADESAFEELQREEALETQTDERAAAQGENLPPFPLR